MGKRTHSQIMTRVVEDAGRCELCGSKRGLEAHHIIPVVCGGDDSDENLICVCQMCHARLTPWRVLTKLGIQKRKYKNERSRVKIELYDMIEEHCERDGWGIASVFDAIEQL